MCHMGRSQRSLWTTGRRRRRRRLCFDLPAIVPPLSLSITAEFPSSSSWGCVELCFLRERKITSGAAATGQNMAPVQHHRRTKTEKHNVQKCCWVVAPEGVWLQLNLLFFHRCWVVSQRSKVQFSHSSTKQEKSHSTLQIPPSEVPLKAS